MATLGILSALAEEQQGLRQMLREPQEFTRAGRSFWAGAYGPHQVVLGLSRIGKVAAATTATAMIEGFGLSHLVFTGVAGGVGEGVQVGDVVVAESCLQHDMDASPLFARYEVPLYGRSRFTCDSALSDWLAQAAREAALTLEREQIVVHRGLIASGDRFVSSADEVASLRQGLAVAGHTVLAVEMEGAAVAQVCVDYGLPLGLVRTISDRADADAPTDFSRFLAEVAGPRARAILTRFLDLLPNS